MANKETVELRIRPVGCNHALPLSLAQHRLWMMDQTDRSATTVCPISAGLRLRGQLDRAVLQAALDRIVERHEVLRTTFPSADGSPIQVIQPQDCGFAWVEDEADDIISVEKISQEEARKPFSLFSGPLTRGRLLRVAAQEHVLLITQHPIVSDRFSMAVFVCELITLYAAILEGHADPLQPLALQYSDYAAWQRQYLQGDLLLTQREFWKHYLSGAPDLLRLPTDRPRPAVPFYSADRVQLSVPAELTVQLRKLAKRLDTTLFLTLLSGWAMLLARWSGQEEVVIGTVVGSRRRLETRPMIGLFENTLPLRVRLPADATVEQVLQQVEATSVAVNAHQDVPFEQGIDVLGTDRTLGANPVFQVLMMLIETLGGPAGPEEVRVPRLTFCDEPTARATTRFDLSLLLSEGEGSWVGTLEYASDLFSRRTIERLVGHWQILLQGMATDARRPITQLPLLTASECEQVLRRFNETTVAHPRDRLIHQLFEEQVVRTPDAIALTYEGQFATYAELNGRANQLARRLRACGIGPDQLVGICVERGVEMIVGLLGVMKAGGAYVPLDPSSPSERVAYILKDVAPQVVLTQDRFRNISPFETVPCITLDGQWEQIAQHDDTNLDPRMMGLAACHLAYVIYTSGSTGKPNGVMVEHRNVVNHWHAVERLYRDPIECRRVAVNAPLAFDVSVQQFVLLLSGCTLFVVPEVVRQDAQLLLLFLKRNQIDGIDCTPSQLNTWVSAGLLEISESGLRTVVVGGEAVDEVLWTRVARCTRMVFYNVYGPTECTVFSTVADLRDASAAPHIGRPTENAYVLILDSQHSPVPIGVAGEIFIGGAGVARGYLNRPELTRDRFVADPFGHDPQGQVYRTGDLGRWRADGNIEFLGRNDHQVKIRGFRIELGEIEVQILRYPQVSEAVVIAREDAPGEKRLVAYVIPDERLVSEAALSVEDLRTHLATALPEYMIPNAFAILRSLPLTSNGKVDRRALAMLPLRDLSQQYEAPQGKIEVNLAGIWQEVLLVERVGRRDNFFALGGHSLLAMRLMVRVGGHFGIQISINDIFQHATFQKMAEFVRRQLPENHTPSLSNPTEFEEVIL